MRVILTGVSHRTAPVEVREKLAVPGDRTPAFLRALCEVAEVSEAALLSTCNRTELYALAGGETCQERLLDFLGGHAGLRPAQLQPHVYCFEGSPSVRHLFRVAAGLDSMVLGEAQIQAQVKEALRLAQGAGTAGAVVGTMFQYALQAGKRARDETEITRGAVSVSLAAVEMARQIFGRLHEHTAMVVGAGETGEQTARLLVDAGISKRILVCNRTFAGAEEVAQRLNGVPLPFDRMPEGLREADIVISSTGSMHPILTREMVRPVMHARRGRPLFLIDIAVPRDIEPAAGDLDNVFLYNIDDLQAVVHKNLAVRQSEVDKVDGIIEEEVRRFQGWLRGLEVGPTIAALQQEAERIRAGEMERLGGKLAHLPERDRAVVEALVRGVVNKLMRGPILHLKEAAATGNGYHEVEAVRAIFGLQIADCGLRIGGDESAEVGSAEDNSAGAPAVRNPQSAIRNPQLEAPHSPEVRR